MATTSSRKVLLLTGTVLVLVLIWSFISLQDAYTEAYAHQNHQLSLSQGLHRLLHSDHNIQDETHSFQQTDGTTQHQEPSSDTNIDDKITTEQTTSTVSTSSATSASSTTTTNPQSTPLILYAYSDSTWAYRNLEFFLTHGLHQSATFVFILNGALADSTTTENPTPHQTGSSDDSLPPYTVPETILSAQTLLEKYTTLHPNIHIILRPNKCYDLGAYGETLLSHNASYLNTHKKFILLNASVRGPFLPMWSQECWSTAYLRPILSGQRDYLNRTVKVTGMTMNCVSGRPRHLQSMVLAVDDVGLKIMAGLDPERDVGGEEAVFPGQIGLSKCPRDYREAVDQVETQLTSLVHAYVHPVTGEKYTVRPMFALGWATPGYVDDCSNGDVNASPGAYEGGDLHVWETMFIKTRWGVERDEVEKLTEWLDGSVESGLRNGSWDVC